MAISQPYMTPNFVDYDVSGNRRPTPGMSTNSMGGVYSSALNRWLAQQAESKKAYKTAEQPLSETVQMFQKGGGYGAGQISMIEDEARRAKAQALADQVASGMSSGSLATSTGLRVASDASKAKLNVEDTRTQFLAQALQALSGIKAQYAQQAGSVYDPFANTYMGVKAQTSTPIMTKSTGLEQYFANLEKTRAETAALNKSASGTYNTLQF